MDDHLTIFSSIIPKSKEEILTLEDIFTTHSNLINIDLERGHEFTHLGRNGKVIPSLRFANEEDIEEIVSIFKDVYENTYPYKKMESKPELLKMIRSPNYYWIVFKIKPNITIGCIGIHLNYDDKKAIMFGFAFKKKYQQKVDISTASLACMIAPAYKFRDRISIWSCEVRSSFTSIQYLTAAAGLSPMAFLPNKDIFYNRPESEILFVIHDRNTIFNKRSTLRPELISQAIFCYFHAFQKNNLELPIIRNYENIESKLNHSEVLRKRNKLIIKTERDKFGNELKTLSIKETSSYFQFLYYKNIKIIEKVDYKVDSLEELFIFLDEMKREILALDLRYFEVYLSAYNALHQTLFFKAGFKPTGYIPAFKYNSAKDIFEDQIVFVFHEKELSKNVCLIPETEEFLRTIKYYKDIQKE